MAYGLIIAAVKPEAFSAFKAKVRLASPADKDSLPFLDFEKIVITTHFHLSAGTGDQRLNAALIDLFESGEKIEDIYWHPYRPPLFQDRNIIQKKNLAFKKAYEDMLSKIPKDHVQSWNADFSPMVNLVDFAAKNNLSLVTFLDRPMDEERANKVHLPINIGTNQTS